MGISFKVSKTGTRFRPRPSAAQEEESLIGESSRGSSHVFTGAGLKLEGNVSEATNGVARVLVASSYSGELPLPEHEVSFTLNLFQKGYFIGKPIETENIQVLLQDCKSLHPYDRASETLFSAIESGWLPGDILDDIPSKYFDGTLICEVRDYRKCISDQGTPVSTAEPVPVINKVRLRMSLENVVKDIPLISDDSWTYSDLMEVESRIVKALQPKLNLDPSPIFDRLCDHPDSMKLNLGIGRKKRLRPEVTVASNNQAHGKKVCIDRLSEKARLKQDDQGTVGHAVVQQTDENTTAQYSSCGISSIRPTNFSQETPKPTLPFSSHAKLQPAISYQGSVHDRESGSPASFSGVNSSPQSLIGSYSDTVNGNLSFHGKRENQDPQMTPTALKRAKHNPLRLDGIQQQQDVAHLVGLSGAEMNWKNQLLHSQIDMKGIQYSNAGTQRYPQVMNNLSNQETMASFYFNQQGMRFGSKEEQNDSEKLDGQGIEGSKESMQPENSTLEQQQSRSQHLLHQPSMRNHLPPITQWHNPRPQYDKDMRKDDMAQKRKLVHSPRVSSGPMVQSPVSSKSGEISSGSIGGQFSAVVTTSALGSQKDKSIANSNAIVGAPSVTSSPSDSMNRQHQAAVTAKRKSNSVPKTQVISGVGSPASVSNMNAPLNANSPSVGNVPMGDQVILERFTKLQMITQRCQLNLKKNKVNDYPRRKAASYSSQDISFSLSNLLNAEDDMDQMNPLSRSLIGGTTNTCKSRLMSFVRADVTYQGVPTGVHCRLTMTEKPSDGTVAMHYGDSDDTDSSNAQDPVIHLPTTRHADLLAAQFCSLMERDGYQKTEDHIRPIPVRMGATSSSQATVPGISSDNTASEVKQEVISPAAISNNSMGSTPNSARMLASGSGNQGLPVSQGYLPGSGMASRAQQLDQPLLHQQLMQQNQQFQIQQQQQQQQQISHLQRSSPLIPTNSLSHLMGQNQQYQQNHMVNNKPTPLQLQQLQQQQQQLPRKMMMGLGGAMGMGNMAGLGGLGNMMGMGGVRPMNTGAGPGFGTGIRQSSLSIAQAAAMRLAVQQNRAASLFSPQSGMAGNGNQLLQNSTGIPMLSHTLNRSNPNPLQRNPMSAMGPPKIPGASFYLSPQHHLQLQQLQQQQQQQQQQQGPVGSPTMVMQQQISPQQNVMSPQQLSSSLMQQMNNTAPGPTSPQLSSQTHGSVGSITSSPMEQLQGANNGGGLNNI